jgi:hypothetical protein
MPSAEEAKTPAILDAVVDRETLPAGKCDLRGITGLALPTILLTPTTLFDVLNTDHIAAHLGFDLFSSRGHKIDCAAPLPAWFKGKHNVKTHKMKDTTLLFYLQLNNIQ